MSILSDQAEALYGLPSTVIIDGAGYSLEGEPPVYPITVKVAGYNTQAV